VPAAGAGRRSGATSTGAFLWRMREKYVIRDFHPLVFFYVFGILVAAIGVALGAAMTTSYPR
jgi:hypothetical protein